MRHHGADARPHRRTRRGLARVRAAVAGRRRRAARRGRLTFLGHSTVLIEVDDLRILTDPVLREGLGPVRRQVRAVLPELFADLDAVFISHGHHDHLDPPSLRRIPGKPTVIVPRGFGRLGEQAGPGPGRGGRARRPADDRPRPASRSRRATTRGGASRSGPSGPAIGCVIAGSRTVYFPGDTDLFPGMEALAGTLDVALLPVWGWGPTIGPRPHGPGAGRARPRRSSGRACDPDPLGHVLPGRPAARRARAVRRAGQRVRGRARAASPPTSRSASSRRARASTCPARPRQRNPPVPADPAVAGGVRAGDEGSGSAEGDVGDDAEGGEQDHEEEEQAGKTPMASTSRYWLCADIWRLLSGSRRGGRRWWRPMTRSCRDGRSRTHGRRRRDPRGHERPHPRWTDDDVGPAGSRLRVSRPRRRARRATGRPASDSGSPCTRAKSAGPPSRITPASGSPSSSPPRHVALTPAPPTARGRPRRAARPPRRAGSPASSRRRSRCPVAIETPPPGGRSRSRPRRVRAAPRSGPGPPSLAKRGSSVVVANVCHDAMTASVDTRRTPLRTMAAATSASSSNPCSRASTPASAPARAPARYPLCAVTRAPRAWTAATTRRSSSTDHGLTPRGRVRRGRA